MDAEVLQFPKLAASVPITEGATDAEIIQNLTQALEIQGQSIKLMIDVITGLDSRVRRLELTERRRQRNHALYNAAGDKIGG